MYGGEREIFDPICVIITLAHLIDDLLKVHLDGAALDVRMLVRTVDQNRQLL